MNFVCLLQLSIAPLRDVITQLGIFLYRSYIFIELQLRFIPRSLLIVFGAWGIVKIIQARSGSKKLPRVDTRHEFIYDEGEIRIVIRHKNPQLYRKLSAHQIVMQAYYKFLCKKCVSPLRKYKQHWKCSCTALYGNHDVFAALMNAKNALLRSLS